MLCLLLFIPLVGTERRSEEPPAHSQNPLRRYLNEGGALFAAGNYGAAAKVYEAGAQSAARHGEHKLAARCLNNAGGSYLKIFQYPQALSAFLRCREMAGRAGELETYGAASSNISALYLQNNDVESAAAVMDQALPYLERIGEARNRARLLLQLGTVRMEQNRHDEARQALRRAIDMAEQAGDERAVAYGFERLGLIYLREGDWREAENHLVEAFRLRKIHGLWELGHSCRLLATLRIAQRDWAGAGVLLDRAVDFVRSEPTFSWPWLTYQMRGQVREAQGRIDEALVDFRVALDLSRRFRLDVLPADFTRVLTDIRLDDIYSSFVECSARVALRGKRRDLEREAFRAAEENRAASLRALLAEAGDWRGKLPPAYWETLAETHRAEVEALRQQTPAARAQLETVRSALVEMESRAGANRTEETRDLIQRTQRSLDHRSALLAFHLGRNESYLWSVTDRSFQLLRLPPGASLAAEAERFASLVCANSPRATETGRALYKILFGGLGSDVRGKGRWLLALDEPLFEVPFAALTVSHAKSGRPVYLVEERAVEIVPGAMWLRAPEKRRPMQMVHGPFVGVGDAIYNAADPRWDKAGVPANLPRLVASAREIQACGRAWPSDTPPILLTGTSASKAHVRAALDRKPSVIHFATHVIQATTARIAQPNPRIHPDPLGADEQTRAALRQSGSGMMIQLVLSPSAGSGGEFLGPDEIKNWTVPAGLITINGCSSGGAALRGAGLMGMTRPWLAAGAAAVTATRWSAPDDDGRLFLSLYRHLRASSEPDPATALRLAQLDMLHAGDWRAKPGFWASYFLVGSY